MQLLKAAATTVCLSLAYFGGASCHGQELANHDTASAGAKPGVTADSVDVINAQQIAINRDCLDKEVTHLKLMIDSGTLDPIRTEVFDKHPLVSAVLDAPHIKLTYKGKQYFVPLSAEYPNIIAVFTLNGGQTYAAFSPTRGEKYSLRGCLEK